MKTAIGALLLLLVLVAFIFLAGLQGLSTTASTSTVAPSLSVVMVIASGLVVAVLVVYLLGRGR